jgi:hypothetical protein
MPVLPAFSTPADLKDFSDSPAQQAAMDASWNATLNRFAEQAKVPDPWDMINFGPCPAYYNPLTTDVPAGAVSAPITWNAFPGRIPAYFPDSPSDWNNWADSGVPAADQIDVDLCNGGAAIPPTVYTPTGPRGWQDEYCEWSVTRNAAGKITSVMFTCENPEYWLTLWQVSPQKVLQLYRQLVNADVQLDDLCLLDAKGKPVVDPTTGQPAYNPLNKWNRGTQTLADSGGAVHLTSSPNTLGAEVILAAVAAMPRVKDGQPVQDAAQLVCFAKYGRIGRHSDPTIGQSVNSLVNYAGMQQVSATLSNPVGLYMQTPDFSAFKTPDGTPASTFWHVVRGHAKGSASDIDRILHVKFSVPEKYNYAVGDITINGQAIQYASQIAQQFNMALMATVFAGSGVTQTPVGATVSNPNPSPAASALQAESVFLAARQAEYVANEIPLSFPILALPLKNGQALSQVALMLNTADASGEATFSVPEGGLTISVTGKGSVETTQGQQGYYLVTLAVDPSAKPGDRTILASVGGMPATPYAAVGLLTVVAGPAVTASTGTTSNTRTLHVRGGRA